MLATTAEPSSRSGCSAVGSWAKVAGSAATRSTTSITCVIGSSTAARQCNVPQHSSSACGSPLPNRQAGSVGGSTKWRKECGDPGSASCCEPPASLACTAVEEQGWGSWWCGRLVPGWHGMQGPSSCPNLRHAFAPSLLLETQIQPRPTPTRPAAQPVLRHRLPLGPGATQTGARACDGACAPAALLPQPARPCVLHQPRQAAQT